MFRFTPSTSSVSTMVQLLPGYTPMVRSVSNPCQADFPHKYTQKNYLDPIVNMSRQIKDFYQYFEIINILFVLLGIVIGLNRFYFIFIYIQYIKFRYYASSDIREKINNMRVQLEVLRTTSDNRYIRKFAEIIQKIGNAFANGFFGGNVVMFNGGFMACNIF